MSGLKPVRARRDDALTRVDWKQLEILLAVYFRGQGYRVEHVGTGATGARSDGGIDLKLRRDDEYVLVQAKHWNAYQVPHNAVHELLGVMVNEGATGAILVTSGEFTKAAIEAATRQGHVRLIDGAELRALLGPLPAGDESPRLPMVSQPRPARHHGTAAAGRDDPYRAANAFARAAGERLLDAAEDRIRYGRNGRAPGKALAMAGLDLLLLKLAALAVSFLLLWFALRFAMESLHSAVTPRPLPVSAAPVPALPAPVGAPRLMQQAAETQAVTVQHVRVAPPTAAEIRESQRRADEAIRVIEASTPEM